MVCKLAEQEGSGQELGLRCAGESTFTQGPSQLSPKGQG